MHDVRLAIGAIDRLAIGSGLGAQGDTFMRWLPPLADVAAHGKQVPGPVTQLLAGTQQLAGIGHLRCQFLVVLHAQLFTLLRGRQWLLGEVFLAGLDAD